MREKELFLNYMCTKVVKYPDKSGGKNGGSWLFLASPGSALPPTAEKILSHLLPWQFAVSQDANLIAVLQV